MSHATYIQRCLELAQNAKGYTTPNPMVGAVLVHDGRVIGEGWHHYYGATHAEVNCLDTVAAADRHLIPDSTMYVNLEPCAHHGLTPPCANRIIAENIKKVVIANKDPFEKVDGRGFGILEAAGVEVISGILKPEGLWVNRRFFCFHTQKRPYIILKWAQTADGFIAPQDKSRMQITGPESMQQVHKWRTEEAAIMVGYLTALNDNPQLTARMHTGRQPLRIVLDRSLTLPNTHNIYNEQAATWIINEQQETISGNIHFVQLPFGYDLMDRLFARLHEANILSMIVEGGAELFNSFIENGIWDEARVFTGPTNIGEGLAAPVLKNETHAFRTSYGADQFDFYVNKSSQYHYIEGMDL